MFVPPRAADPAAILIAFSMSNPRRALALVCIALAALFFCQMAAWDYRNVPCLFRLTPGCASSQLNRSSALRGEHLKVQTIGNIKYVGPDEALVEYLFEAENATAADEANPDATQIKIAAFRKAFYRWRLEQ
jgi:hypothetical protein